MADEEPFYSPNRKARAKRVASPGVRQWQLREGDRVLTCELRDDARAGAGFVVQLLEDGELLVSRRCVTVEVARDIAQIFKTRSSAGRVDRADG